jgi:para-aminobenzoate synthetase component 1
MLPYIQAFPIEVTRIPDWGQLWKSSDRHAFVLESGKGGTYTIAGRSPVSVVQGKGRQAEAVDWLPDGTCRRTRLDGEPLQAISRWMAPYRSPQVPGAPKLTGGCVGYLGYDVVRSLERLPESAQDDLGIPDYVMMRFEELWVVNQETATLYCCIHVPHDPQGQEEKDSASLDRKYRRAADAALNLKTEWDAITAYGQQSSVASRIQQMGAIVEAEDRDIDPERLAGLERAFDKEAFMDAVRRIQEYIAAGDVFQVNLSVRQSRALHMSPERLYEWLRLVNPSPYMGYLRLDGFELVSASPELLVELEGGRVRTRPIAGTRRRGASPEEDRRMRDELLQNEKERAEHIMLVDLERNDLGRISRYGSVQVTELMGIETYSHVMHIVSEVTGQLAEGKNCYDVIAATFPGGTITGAPKVRTMQIIEELEPVRRGPYTGSIGWIDYNGNMELNIVIRTLLSCRGKAYVQAGAGIVIDSVPEREYKESLNKAKALWKALELSEKHPLWREEEDGRLL